MSDVTPINRPSATTLEPRVRPSKPDNSATSTQRGEDQVELSNNAQYLSKIAELPDIRQDLIDSVKASIADGTYETEEKTEAAIENLLEDIL